MYLYVGLRRKGARLIGAAECTSVSPITISERGLIRINGEMLSITDHEHLAYCDGFNSFADMIAFWRAENGLPFQGDLYAWKRLFLAENTTDAEANCE